MEEPGQETLPLIIIVSQVPHNTVKILKQPILREFPLRYSDPASSTSRADNRIFISVANDVVNDTTDSELAGRVLHVDARESGSVLLVQAHAEDLDSKATRGKRSPRIFKKHF